MKIRTLLAGLVVVVALTACGTPPTSADGVSPLFNDDTTQTDTTGRTGKPMGSGN